MRRLFHGGKLFHGVSWLTIALLMVALAPAALAEENSDSELTYETESVNPRPGQPGHRYHEEWQGDYPTPGSEKNFRVIRTLPLPEGFLGNMATDPAGERVWLVSLGPPTKKGPSTLYELDPKDGSILRQAEMPFEGDLNSPVYIDGYLYQGVFHQSKMYKVSVSPSSFGEIKNVVDLPTLNDLNLVDESHPMPFIEFGGVAVSPDNQVVIHADDVGEFIKIDRDTGKILDRTRTLKALGGILGVARNSGEFLVVGNSDARGGYCALSYPPALSRSPEQKDISWALLDGESGEVLASVRRQNSRAYASGVSLLAHREVTGTPFGQFSFLATGEEGLLEIEWTPGADAY